jgi:hypothetical protein
MRANRRSASELARQAPGMARRPGATHEPPVTGAAGTCGDWVLLSYRLPREPSTPRSAVWRKLKKLGVAQISDGLVALPAGARTREQLEWVAEEVTDAGGNATIWLAQPASRAQEDQLARTMAAARAAEYRALITAAAAETADPSRAVRRLRNELRAIQRRDYFPPPERDQAEAAVQAIADLPGQPPARTVSIPANLPGQEIP